MRNTLPKTGPHINESAVINLDDAEGEGTHWVAYKKRKSVVHYYDSFGNLQPPKEFVDYICAGSNGTKQIYYNYAREQQFNTVWCGHLCLRFLRRSKHTPHRQDGSYLYNPNG